MKKVIKYIATILVLAWNGAVTIFSGLIFLGCFSTLVDKLFNNNIVACAGLAMSLIVVTLFVGNVVHEKMK